MRNEVGELDDVARVGIDERLVPHRLTVVPDLHNVGEGNGAVLLRNELELGRVLVVFCTELALSLGDRIVRRDGGGGGRHVGCSGKDEQGSTGKDLKNAQGFTNEEPKETTLLALLKATFATAFATGIPFCKTPGVRQCIFDTTSISPTTHNLLVNVCVLSDVTRVPSPVCGTIGSDIELGPDKGHGSVLQAELGPSRERVVKPLRTEELENSAGQLCARTSRVRCAPRVTTQGGSSR